MSTRFASLSATVLLTVIAAAGAGAPGRAHATASAPGPLACVFDRLEGPDREVVANSVMGGQPGDARSKAAAEVLDRAVQACVTAHGWDKRRASLSGAYAMNRTVYDLLERDFAAAGFAPGKIKILWATLSEDDRAALRQPDLPDVVMERLIVQLKTVGVPNNAPDLLEAYSSLTALAEVAAIEAQWVRP